MRTRGSRPLPGFNNSGHTVSGNASLQRQISHESHCGVQYSRVHQIYSDVPAISVLPDHNRVAVHISYQFSKTSGKVMEKVFMVDELEEKPGEGLNFQHYVDGIRRRHMYFLMPFFLGWLVVWSASWVLPSVYKSSTLILVEQPSMPKDYVTPNVVDDLQARCRASASRFSVAPVCCTLSMSWVYTQRTLPPYPRRPWSSACAKTSRLNW